MVYDRLADGGYLLRRQRPDGLWELAQIKPRASKN
jgi:hypothetical protein